MAKTKNANKRATRKMVEKTVERLEGRARKGRNPRRSGNRRGGAFLSTSVSISPRNSQRVRLYGTDRVFHIPDASRFSQGSTMVDFAITSEVLPRLAHMGEAYQRVRFKKLVFRIVSMCPTTTSGGFAAAFVADPTDVLGSGNDALNRVVAQTGSKITKIWESATITSKLSGDLLFTSIPPQGDLRLSSPGRLWVVCESKPSSTVPMTIYVDWEVDFSVPSLESSTHEAGVLICQKNFYTRSSKVGLWWEDGSGGDDPRTAVPGIEFDKFYQSKNKFYLDFTDEAGNYDTWVLVNDQAHGVTFAPVGRNGKPIVKTTSKNQWAMEKGDVLTPLAENRLAGAEFLCIPTPSAPSFSRAYDKAGCSRSSYLTSLPPKSIALSTPTKSSLQRELTLAQLQEKLMEFQLKSSDLSRSPSFEVLE